MRKKQTGLGIDDDWEVTRDVGIRKPLGVVLSINLDQLEIDQISRAAESVGLTSVSFLREAALLVANDPSLRDQLPRSGSQEQLVISQTTLVEIEAEHQAELTNERTLCS